MLESLNGRLFNAIIDIKFALHCAAWLFAIVLKTTGHDPHIFKNDVNSKILNNNSEKIFI